MNTQRMDVLRSLQSLREAQDQAGLKPGIGRDEAPINRTGGYSVEYVDLSSATAVEVPKSGTRLVYKRAGSTAGGLLDIECGGQVIAFAPGDAINGPFERFQVARNAGSVTSGTALLVVETDPRARFDQLPGTDGAAQAPTTGDAQAQSVATVTGANFPSAATAGVSIAGMSGVAAIIDAGSRTITSGQAYWARYDPALGAWVPVSGLYANIGGNSSRYEAVPDLPVSASYGRVALVLVNLTLSGAGNATVYYRAR